LSFVCVFVVIGRKKGWNFSLLRVSRDHLPCGAVVMQSIASTAPYLPPAGQLRLIPIYYAP